MINLLPPDSKKTLFYARRNTQLIRFVIGLSIGILGLLVVIGASVFYLQQETKTYEEAVSSTKAELKKENEAETVQRVQDISNSLKLVVSVLEQEVLFSKLLRQVGAVMPQGTVLEDLSLNNELTGALDLRAGAVDYRSASQVQVNLQDSKNSVLQRADIVNIKCDSSADNDKPDPYPCEITLRALFSKDNNFMLISPKGAAR